MGKVVVTEFISVDGVIDTPGGGDFEHAGWTFKFDRGPDGDKFKLDELKAAGVQLLGRHTYDIFAAAWPTMTGDFAELMNGMPKHVVSTTLTPETATWSNSTVIAADVPGRVQRLKDETKGDVLVAGSARLVRTLAKLDLVDEYRLMTFPIVLGTGERLFGEGVYAVLKLVDTTPLGPDGVVVLTYVPRR